MEEIKLYIYRGRYNKIDKSGSSLTREITLQGEFRDAVNVVNPQIVIDTSNVNVTTNNILQTNYAYITSLKRYYFITNIEMTRKNLITLTLHVDVLYSHFNTLKTSHGYIARNQYDYNALLPDERRIIKNISTQRIQTISNVASGSKVNTEFNYNLAVYQNIAISYIDSSISLTDFTSLATGYVSSVLFPTERVSNYYDLNTAIVSMVTTSKLAYALYEILNNNPVASFVGDITVYPFKISDIVGSAYDNINFIIGTELINDGDGNAVKVNRLKHSISKEIIIKDFILDDNITPTDFIDLNPYSKYELYIPFYGYYELNYNALRNHRLIVYYLTNFKTGSSTVYLCDYTDTTKRNIIFSAPVQLGIKLGTTIENTRQVNEQKTQNNFNTSMSLISTVLGGITAGVGALTGNPLLIAGGVAGTTLGITKTLGQHEINEQRNYLQGNVQFGSDSTSILSPFDVYLRITTYTVQYPLDSNYLLENGGVCNKYVSTLINTFGYTEFADIEIVVTPNTEYSPTTEEINEFVDLFKKGVYF